MEYINVPFMEKDVAIKICQVCAIDFTLQHFLLPLVDAMESNGWEVHSVCSPGANLNKLTRKGYKVSQIKIRRSLNLFGHLVSIIRLYIFFKRNKFDVVHVHTPVASLLGRIAAYMAKVPLVVYTAHGYYFHDEMHAWKKKIYILLERFGGELTDIIFTQSAEDGLATEQYEIINSGRTYVIGNGVPPETFNYEMKSVARLIARRQFRISCDSTAIGIVGRCVEEKGYLEFIDAARTLLSRGESKLNFVFVGSKTDGDKNGVEALMYQLKKEFEDNVTVLGYQEDMPFVYSALDIFCLPSYREGMPRSVIEAMMMGLPVVATNIRGSRELIENEVNGILIPPRSSVHLRCALERLIADPELRSTLANSAVKKAKRDYREDVILKKQIEIIEAYL